MSKGIINSLTGEFVELSTVQPVTIVTSAKQVFKTNYTDNTVDNDAEHNSGDYIIDDSQYIDFKKLLQRSNNCSKEAQSFLQNIPIVDNVGGITESEIDKVIGDNGINPELPSTELSTGTTERPQESNEVVNPVVNSPDVVQNEQLTDK